MDGIADEREQPQPNETVAISSVAPPAIPTGEDTNAEQPVQSSLVQSLLQEQPDEVGGKKKKKKKKAKSGRQKELERLTKATKTIFTSPEKLNVVCKRVNSLLSDEKKTLLEVCQTIDKQDVGRLSYEQFRLILKDRLPQMSREDLFVLTKLFEVEGLIDYRAILDETAGAGILQHVTQLVVPPLKGEIVLEKKPPKELKRPFNEPFQLTHPRYVTLFLRLTTFDSYNAYPGHIRLTVPDHMSVYALSKMVIDETDLAIRTVNISREKKLSPKDIFDPKCSLEECHLLGAYVDGTHNQQFPSYTLYYDYFPMGICGDCPILKCDYYMK